jgi:hypothetical protein
MTTTRKRSKCKRSKKGGFITKSTRIFGIPFEVIKPSILDKRTCYKIGPINWCTRN